MRMRSNAPEEGCKQEGYRYVAILTEPPFGSQLLLLEVAQRVGGLNRRQMIEF